MSSKHTRDDRKGQKHERVTERCLAILFTPAAPLHNCQLKKSTDSNDGENLCHCDRPHGDNTTHICQNKNGQKEIVDFNAKEVLEEFKLRNKTCYWNPALVDSVKSLEYVGFLEPYTILVKGNDIHLENLRTAWGRRVLKDPANFRVERIGDVNGIQIQVVPQTQFIPLPEALCLIILELNNQQIVATLDTVRERLHHCYQGLHLPSDQLLYDTLGNLIRERKVFHTGCGYFVVTPDTFRLPTDDLKDSNLSTTWMHYHPMYIPAMFSQYPRAPMRSISCQVDVEPEQQKPSTEHIPRVEQHLTSKVLQPLPESCNVIEKCDPELTAPRLTRSLSARRPREKNKTEEVTEIKVHRSSSVKVRQEKEKTEPADVNLKKSNINQNKNKGEKVSLLSKLFGRGKKKPVVPPKKVVEYATFSAQFPPPEWMWYQQQQEKHHRVEQWVHQQTVKVATWHHVQNPVPESGGQKNEDQNITIRERSSTMPTRTKVVDQGRRPSFSKPRSSKHKEATSPTVYQNNAEENVPPPYSLHIGTSHQHSYMRTPLYSSTPRVPEGQVLQPQGGSASQMDNTISHLYSRYPQENLVSSHGDGKENIHHSIHQSNHQSVHQRKSHKSKRKSHHDRHSGVIPPVSQPNDISYEYQGKLPQKHSAMGVSHSSGVNCVGLEEEAMVKKSNRRPKSYHSSRHMHHKPSDKHTSQDHCHIYANVHIQQPQVHRDKGQEKNKSHSSRRSKANRKSCPPLESDLKDHVISDRLQVCIPELDQKSDQTSERDTAESHSSRDGRSQSTADGSEQSCGTVINTRADVHRPNEILVHETKEPSLGDSGFSSPQNCDSSLEHKVSDSNLKSNYLVYNELTGKPLNNSLHRLDECTEDAESTGRITPGTLYENVKIDQNTVLNNMKYLHKDINVSSQNLNELKCPPEMVHNGAMDSYDLQKPVMKKFNLEGDFHVVGVV